MTRRPVCAGCARPLSTCLCGWVRPCDNRVAVLILQHPLEASQAKGSAGLLQASLTRCNVHIGESFDAALLAAWLSGRSLLLYPSGPADAPPLSPVEGAAAPPDRLVVLDATWRKSRKLLHLNPLLQQLPRLALRNPPPSRYAIRQAHAPTQRSTLEATCLALQQLEQREQPYADLLNAFDGFVDMLAAPTPRRMG